MLDWDDEPKTQTNASAGDSTTGPTPVNVDDKRVVNGDTDINQLAPFKYPWAWEYFMNANKNHWTPLDVNMAQDVHDYHHRLTAPEK
ncbi:ribonucleotide-diphosphate reductase subunit beta, partial [Marinobacter alexandrii]